MSMFLDIPGIAGESSSPNPNWNNKIMIYNVSHHTGSPSHVVPNKGTIPKPSNFGDLSFTKELDKSTPNLLKKLPSGDPIPLCYVRTSRPGGAKVGSTDGLFEAETVTLKNVYVKSYHTSATPGPGGLPMESWSFSFTAMTETYQTVNPGTGTLNPPQTFGWDVSQNQTAGS